MNIRSLLPAMVLLPASLLLAQGEVKEAASPKLSEANKHYQKLVDEYNAVQDDYGKRIQKVTRSDEYKKLRKARDRKGIRALTSKVERPDVAGFVTRFQAGAKQHASTPTAADFLYWVVMNGGRQRVAVEEAVDTLVDHHLASKKMWLLAGNYIYFQRHLGVERTLEALDAIIDGSPHKEAVAEALYAKWWMLRGQDVEEAEACLAKLKKVAPDSIPVLRLNGPDFVRERLQIGMVAPEIEGIDIDGIQFKLSDYRGKVVVLDFWGNW